MDEESDARGDDAVVVLGQSGGEDAGPTVKGAVAVGAALGQSGGTVGRTLGQILREATIVREVSRDRTWQSFMLCESV